MENNDIISISSDSDNEDPQEVVEDMKPLGITDENAATVQRGKYLPPILKQISLRILYSRRVRHL